MWTWSGPRRPQPPANRDAPVAWLLVLALAGGLVVMSPAAPRQDQATQDQATQDQATQDQATQDQATQDQATQDQATSDCPSGAIAAAASPPQRSLCDWTPQLAAPALPAPVRSSVAADQDQVRSGNC